MFWSIAWFELKKRLRMVSTYIYFAILFGIAFLLFIAASGAFEGVRIGFGNAGGKVFINSPFVLNLYITLISYFGILITSSIMGQAIFQDFESSSYPLFFTKPISKTSYVGGRFLGSMLVLLFIFSGIGFGSFFGSIMPFVDEKLLTENRLIAYIQPYLTSLIPNIFFTGAIFFAMSSLLRKIRPVYVGSVIFLVGYLIAESLLADLDNKTLAALLDPFGLTATGQITEYWTIIEKNTRLVALEGVLLYNRLIWLGVGTGFLALTFSRFRFTHGVLGGKDAKQSKQEISEEIVSSSVSIPPSHKSYNPLLLLPSLTWLAFKETVKNVYFLVIVLAGVLFLIATSQALSSIYGTSVYPVTYAVLEVVGGSFALFMLIIITFYSGELVWRERDAKVDQLFDTLPIPTWLPLLSKLIALILVQVLLLFVIMLGGIAIQIYKGYFHFEPGLYFADLFGIQLLGYALICVLAIVIQVLVNHKYVGHFIMVLYYLMTIFLSSFGFEHYLYQYGSMPSRTYSDMNGFGHFVAPVFWFSLYWATFAIFLALLSNLFWVRGKESGVKFRFALARQRLSKKQLLPILSVFVVFLGLGGFIFNNTNILNKYQTSYEQEVLQASYEKQFKLYESKPQPRLTDVTVNFDLFPDKRFLAIKGKYELINKTNEPIEAVLVNLLPDIKIKKLALGSLENSIQENKEMSAYTFSLETPMKPGETTTLEFELEYPNKGFPNSGPNNQIVYNGTFFNSSYLPSIGYSEGFELSDDTIRRNHGLEPKERMADLEDSNARQNTYISSFADWVTFETIVSTSKDQIAIAPGSLVKEWEENGRRYFHYKSDKKGLNFFSVLSADYQVKRDKWNDIDIEIYYHKGHEYNLDKMIEAIKKSLDYFTKNFSPYQHKQVRIVEFPRYASFAQAFAGTVPYSESIGFIAKVDPDDEKDVDYPYYVTAHEVAHQWWAHQVIGANVQGATMLSETLAQYSALMVMKQKYGAKKMKRFLRYELDSYLSGRSFERKKELPLYRVEGQPYIHYRKGSLVMYALQDYLGEDKVNQALASYIKEVAFQEPPYTNSLELITQFEKIVPPELSYLIEDLFKTITLYDNRALSATSEKTSEAKYRVTLKVKANKKRADELGEETDLPLKDLIDIGVLDKNGEFLYLEKHWIDTEEKEIEILVNTLPFEAGIDPLNKLIDRRPGDNIARVQNQSSESSENLSLNQ